MSDAQHNSHGYLTPNALTTLFHGSGKLQTYLPETELFSQGEMIRDVYLIEAGWVRLTQTDHEGREAVVTFRSQGKLLGVAALISQKPLRVSAITLNECRMYRLSAARFLKQVNNDLELSRALNHTLGQQYYDLADDLARLATHSARARLADLLLQFVPEATPTSTGELRLSLPFKQATMASWLAIAPETLSRELKKLEQDGVIRRGNGWVFVTNLERLTREAA